METRTANPTPPVFDAAFRQQFETLVAWRRDVRRFRPDPVPADLIAHLVDLASLSPSVGNSQPWRFARVDAADRRAAVIDSFKRANADALATYHGEKAALYARLKLEGLQIAPVQLAVFCDEATEQGHHLGQLTMPEVLDYSVVGAISTLWLAARMNGLGMGWVSILDPAEVTAALDVPADWRLIAWLCVGWPAEEHIDPELERHGWQSREPACRAILQR